MTKKAPYKGPSADSEEKHEPVSDIDTAAADSLKVLDPKRPIREADIASAFMSTRLSQARDERGSERVPDNKVRPLAPSLWHSDVDAIALEKC